MLANALTSESLGDSLGDEVRALAHRFRPTPIVALPVEGVTLLAKLEFHCPFGSVKDRAAYWALRQAIERGEIGHSTTMIESSSGNFAIALARISQALGLTFIPVIDPNINAHYERTLRTLCRRIVKVEERDDTGGFLKTRLAKVRELVSSIRDSYWTNQLENLDIVDAHYRFTAGEIVAAVPKLDYAFIGVGTGGTIAGVSRRLKEAYPDVRVVAVDVAGSMIFGNQPARRHIPGIGSSIRPALVGKALIDDVVVVDERETTNACHELLATHRLFCGGSTGSVYAAIQRYLPRMRSATPPVALFLCVDNGVPYADTVYSDEWSRRVFGAT